MISIFKNLNFVQIYMKLSPNTSKILKLSARITHAHVGVNEASLPSYFTNMEFQHIYIYSSYWSSLWSIHILALKLKVTSIKGASNVDIGDHIFLV